MTATDSRAFRTYPLDGAALYFQPATGVHVRVANAATRALRRRAPRVAMFGITNACNLACTFCSRDASRPSAWTVATAAAALRGLHDAGTLEVAYGGGEPFAFRGFAELIAELDTTTCLAQHVTTNGTLIRSATWPAFAGRLGVVRVSIYDDVPWRPAVDVLASHGQRFGANLLVDTAALPGLPARLAALAASGCEDASLLSYVGPARTRHLDDAGRARLAAIIADSPLPCRLSVCFGDRVSVPRLPTGLAGDCGAGRDFISITPDRRVQSCSFQDRSLPGATSEEILAAWHTQQARLAAPSPRAGCARLHPTSAPAPLPPPIAIWQAFAGNNSGECVLVATFATVTDARAYLAELTPGWAPDGDYTPAWRQLFLDEGVATTGGVTGPTWSGDDASPREMVAIGASVLAVQYAADDAFPELRALAWKRGAHVVPGGVHTHGDLTLVVAVRCDGDADRARLLAAAAAGWLVDGAAPVPARAYPHGDVVIVLAPLLGGASSLPTLAAAQVAVDRLVGGRPHAAEICDLRLTDDALIAAKQRLGHRPPLVPRLWATFWGGDGATAAAAFAGSLGDARVTVASHVALVDPAPDRKRLAVLAYRRGATVSVFDSAELELSAALWVEPPPRTKGMRAARPAIDRAAFEPTLRAALPRDARLTVTWSEHRSRPPLPGLKLTTATPAAALTALQAFAAGIDARLNLWASEVDPVGAMLRRLLTGLDR
ncbi:MAG: radical SAM protein [Kofleriaceae bacterium]